MKIMKKIIAFTLIIACLMPMLISCKKEKLGTPIMTLGDTSVSENMLEFWLSRYKAYFVQYYMNGKDSVEFWNTKVPGTEKTYNETFTEFVIDNARTYTAALYHFDDLGLTLTKAREEAVDKEIAELLYGQADNNKNQFNEILATYGVNADILREIYIIEEKVEMLQSYYYGENGVESPSEEAKNTYYKENYYRFKHIFQYTGSRPVIKDGEFVYGSDGYVKYEEMTKEMDDKVKNETKALYEDIKNGQLDFDEILKIYNEDIANEEYPNGYYVTSTTIYAQEVLDKVFTMDVDSYAYVESEYGVHIIKRLALETGAYSKAENQDFFGDFEDNLIQKLFQEKLADEKLLVEVDEELLKKYCLRDVNPNYTY